MKSTQKSDFWMDFTFESCFRTCCDSRDRGRKCFVRFWLQEEGSRNIDWLEHGVPELWFCSPEQMLGRETQNKKPARPPSIQGLMATISVSSHRGQPTEWQADFALILF